MIAVMIKEEKDHIPAAVLSLKEFDLIVKFCICYIRQPLGDERV